MTKEEQKKWLQNHINYWLNRPMFDQWIEQSTIDAKVAELRKQIEALEQA